MVFKIRAKKIRVFNRSERRKSAFIEVSILSRIDQSVFLDSDVAFMHLTN